MFDTWLLYLPRISLTGLVNEERLPKTDKMLPEMDQNWSEIEQNDLKHKGPEIGGGIAVFVNQKVANNFRLIPNENVDSIWIKTSLGMDEGKGETRLGFFYCSPEKKDSNFFDIVNVY